MPDINDIPKNAFTKLESLLRDVNGRPGDKLNDYVDKTNVLVAEKLDATVGKALNKVGDKLEVKADAVFNFVLNKFGLQKTNVQVFEPSYSNNEKVVKGADPNDSANAATGFRNTDRGKLNMHTGTAEAAPMSILGTPIFADVILSHSIKVEGKDVVDEEVHLLWCLCEVTQTKNIVKTVVQGRDGTVKEYISDGDYIVSLKGAFSSTFMQSYPKDITKRLISICKKKAPLKVTSEFLLMFDIAELVIDEFTFDQVEGKQNVQKFDLKCCSDTPLILKQKQGV
jgi:Domain of unknown function (DUF6046)